MPSIGTFVRATLVAPVVFGSIVMQPVMGVVLTGNANCDASGAIANGALNDCTTALAHGSECTPTCDTGYVISGIRSCSGGTLIDTAVCISSPYEHGRRLLLASSWTQVGGDIDGEAAGDRAGRTVSMSADGTRVAIGATENDANRGHVRVYSESGGTWTQIGGDIDGEDALDNSGVSISMSPDGTRVAIGATQNDGSSGSDSYAGHVRVYTPFCDASTAPTNGVVGTCTNSLASGSTCQPTCDSGYTVSGTSSCTAGTLTAATCAASPSSPAAGGSETPAADLVLDSTPGEYGASVVLGAWFAPAQLAPLTV